MEFIVQGFQQAGVGLVFAVLMYVGHVILVSLRGRKRESWTEWLGLFAPKDLALALRYLGAFLVIGAVFGFAMRWLVPGGEAMAAQSPQHRIASLPWLWLFPAAIAYGFLTTGFTEELLFRGLIGKRFIAWFGYRSGNIAQAVVFAALHVLIVWVGVPDAGPILYILGAGAPGLLGYYAGYAMHERGEGSILYPWMMHAGANFATVMVYVVAPVA